MCVYDMYNVYRKINKSKKNAEKEYIEAKNLQKKENYEISEKLSNILGVKYMKKKILK